MKKEDLEKLSLDELTELSKNIDSIRANKIKEKQENFMKWENRPLGKLQQAIATIEHFYKEDPNKYSPRCGGPTLGLVVYNGNKNSRCFPVGDLLQGGEHRIYYFGNQGIGIIITEDEVLEIIKKVRRDGSPKFKTSLKALFKNESRS